MREPLLIGAALLVLATAPRADTAGPQELCLDPRAANVPWLMGSGERQPPGTIYDTRDPVSRYLLDLPPVPWTTVTKPEPKPPEPKPPVEIAPVPLMGGLAMMAGALVLGAVVLGRRR